MNNITKNLLLALTLVCVIALVVFCIQLIVLNRGVEPVGSGATVSGGSQQDDEDPDAEESSDVQDGEDGEGGFGDSLINAMPATPRPPPQGMRASIMVAENTHLIVYYREESFDFEIGDLDWWFIYTGAGEATLEIAFTQIPQQGAAAHAETFLNNYSGSTTSEFFGDQSIQGSQINGYHVSARAGGGVYEAWLHLLPNSDLALAFVIYYENDFQKEALYELLSTLSMETGNAPAASTAETPVPTDDTGDEDTDED